MDSFWREYNELGLDMGGRIEGTSDGKQSLAYVGRCSRLIYGTISVKSGYFIARKTHLKLCYK